MIEVPQDIPDFPQERTDLIKGARILPEILVLEFEMPDNFSPSDYPVYEKSYPGVSIVYIPEKGKTKDKARKLF